MAPGVMDLFRVGVGGGGEEVLELPLRTGAQPWATMGPGHLLQLQGGQMTIAQACTTASCGKFWRKKKKIPVFKRKLLVGPQLTVLVHYGLNAVWSFSVVLNSGGHTKRRFTKLRGTPTRRRSTRYTKPPSSIQGKRHPFSCGPAQAKLPGKTN